MAGEGVPANPSGWLITVASRRRIEMLAQRGGPPPARGAARRALEPAAAGPVTAASDDTLTLLLLCCHPALTPPSQVALTLRAVGGLTTAEIARAFLVPEATDRAADQPGQAADPAAARGSGCRRRPSWPSRIAAVLQVLYLIFNEGYTASSGRGAARGSS